MIALRTPPGPLDRHHARRGAGFAAISVLCGPPGLCLRTWRAWAANSRRPACVARTPDTVGIALTWAEAVLAAAPAADQALRWVSSAAPAGTPARDRGPMTAYDLDRLWHTLPIDPTTPAARAARLLLTDRLSNVDPDPRRLLAHLSEGDADRTAGAIRLVHALTSLYPEPLWPALLLVPHAADAAAGLAPALNVLERVAVAEPRLPVAVAASPDAYRALLAGAPTARATAVARDGLVELRGVSECELSGLLRAAGVEPPPPTDTLRGLAAGGLTADAADAFVEAARAVRSPSGAGAAADFRSVHERFLFEQLESLPETAGLFRPNRPLPFRHGPQAGEADLLADRLKVVVEVDGGFFHLTPEQYRRDRRKDWLYQRHGYLVLRFLAEDVVNHLESILETVVEAVTHRLSQRGDRP